jgi:hypothetical protein
MYRFLGCLTFLGCAVFRVVRRPRKLKGGNRGPVMLVGCARYGDSVAGSYGGIGCWLLWISAPGVQDGLRRLTEGAFR